MKKKMGFLKIIVIVVVALEILVLAGGFVANNAADSNRSYRAIKTAQVFNYVPLNNFLYAKDEIAFIYDAINNKISGYPTNVPNFINLPIDSIIDAVSADERVHIEYVKDDNYDNGVIIAQEPEAGKLWGDGVVVNLTVNRKYNDIQSMWGYMGESSGKLYLLADKYNSREGTIWKDGEKLIETEMIKLCIDNGNIYYLDYSGVNRLDAQGVSQVLAVKTLRYKVFDEKIYYAGEDGFLYCYDLNDKTNTLVFDGPLMFFHVNSDYIVCHTPHDVSILDTQSYIVIKEMHCEDLISGCSLDRDNVYISETEFIDDDITKTRSRITKFNLKQDEQTEIFYSYEDVFDLIAIDDKIIFTRFTTDYQQEFQYIDTRTMENKFFAPGIDMFSEKNIDDILFDGQKIIYKTSNWKDGAKEQEVYSICIFTGEIKKIG